MKKDKDIFELLKKAKESVEASYHLFKNNFYDFSASRAYYAMFYTPEAILLTKNLSFSKHSAVISAFGREFIKTKILPQKLREYLVSAFDTRQLGDYGAPGSVSKLSNKKSFRRGFTLNSMLLSLSKEKARTLIG
ncbi:MAG: HEPN domain-containing protein [Candidatus Thermoplasmatota archaeon]